MLKSDLIETGLTQEKAKSLLKENGENKLSQKKKASFLTLLLDQVKSPLVYVLIFAGVVTFFLQDYTDSIVIFTAVILNTALGFYQEKKAQNTLYSLNQLLSPKTKVIRDGQQITIDASQVVEGDIVVLTIGSRVPADGVLLKASDFSIDEAILTGESMPVSKKSFSVEEINSKDDLKKAKKENKAFMGTIISTGIAHMYVTKTGMQTEMGKIGKSVGEIKETKTPLQNQLAKVGRILAIAVGVITIIIFAVGELLGYPPLEMFTTSVAVAVAAIPEGLVVTLTVILALGMQRILKRKAIVRKLLAAETLGSVSVICSDKTGTLTLGKMQVVKSEFKDLDLGIKASLLCNDLRDPLEISMWDWAKKKIKGKTSGLIEKYKRIDEMPFSPDTKMISTLHNWEKDNIQFISGAPEVILSKSKVSKRQEQDLKRSFEDFGMQGYRLVGFAFKKTTKTKIAKRVKKEFEWLGFLVYEDPIRRSVKTALIESAKAGIKVKVITGDYAPTATAVLEKLGIKLKSEQIITGEELAKISSQELVRRAKDIILFARTDPEQKLKIVQAFKNSGEVVAMMGDGVNDAPALKNADIGIVVGDASDVSKETADMVLLDSNFSTIIAAIKEGRNIFENIKKVVLYLLSDSFTEVILIGGSLILRLPLPVTAVQILWVNLIEDIFPNLALAFEPDSDEVMEEMPRKRKETILDTEMKVLIFIVGIITDILLLVLFWWFSNGGFHLHHVRTVVFATLGIDSLFYVFSCRSLTHTIFHKNPFENKYLDASVLVGFAMLFGSIYVPFLQKFLRTTPLDFSEVLIVLSMGALNVILIELTKWIFIIKLKKSAKIKQ